MLVKDVMTSDVISIGLNAKVIDAAKLMSEKKIGSLPVVNDSGLVVGIMTESDFIGKQESIAHGYAIPSLLGEWLHGASVEEIFSEAKDKTVDQVMTANPTTITADTPLTVAVQKMLKQDISRIPVVDKGHLVGIIAKRDVLKAVLEI